MQVVGPLDTLTIARLARWILTAVAVVVWTWAALVFVGRPGPSRADGSVDGQSVSGLRPSSEPASLQEVNYAAIRQADLLGLPDASLPAESQTSRATVPDLSIEARLGAVLVGTIAGEPCMARAIFRGQQDKAIKVCRVGQLIGPAKIEAVARDKVIVNLDGNIQVIRRSGSSVPARPGPLVDPDTDQGHLSQIDRFGELISRVLEKARISQVSLPEGGQGLCIEGLDQVPELSALGVHAGDVIVSVNGQEVPNLQKAFQVLRKARSGSGMELEVLRDGQLKRLSFGLGVGR
ncbi:MAG: PDZ domain-containing protein [Sedimentisphaerales bacterium]|nr:PDZ domain-containing protein [Sedimentisphaerales bacterium]